MLSDGYVKYEEAEVHRSAIYHARFQRFVMGYPCARHLHFVLYSWSSYFAFFFELGKYHKIIKIQNGH